MTTKTLKRVLILAGGTGGHVFPGLALARYFRDQGVEVHWLGTPLGIESRLVKEAGIPLHLITISGLRGKGLKTLLMAPFKISAALFQSMRIIHKLKPDVVIGMGGFVSGPGGMASWLMARPLIIHEQNAKAGFTNKILSYLSKRVLAGFPNTFPNHPRTIVTGNPVRTEIIHLAAPRERLKSEERPLRLLVLGGSLGAQAINEVVPEALAAFTVEERPEVLHQTGEKLFDATKKYYESMGITANIKPFIEDMAFAYASADVVLCRAGASTIAELCAVGLGAVLVPYPYAVDDHQTANAQFMVNNKAGLCIQQTELNKDCLIELLKQFSASRKVCLEMAQAAYELRQVKVVEKIFTICEEVCL